MTILIIVAVIFMIGNLANLYLTPRADYKPRVCSPHRWAENSSHRLQCQSCGLVFGDWDAKEKT